MNLESAEISMRADGTEVMTLRIALPREIRSALDFEQESRRALNGCGRALMEYGLGRFDSEGEEIRTGGRTFTSKGRQPETYQTTYGPVEIERHVYQNSDGGRTWVPLEDRARIVGLSTPLMAGVVSGALADGTGREAQRVFAEHHQLDVSLGFIQQLSATTGKLALAKESKWSYERATPPPEAGWIVLGIDGTTSPIIDNGFKQVMVGTITICDKAGEPLETVCIANAPEDGKATFHNRMEREVAAVKKRYPKSRWAGISDGAKDLRPFLEAHTEVMVLDFFHLSEYIHKAAKARYGGTEKPQQWVADALHALKHETGAARQIIDELEYWTTDSEGPALSAAGRKEIETTLGYMKANMDRVDYAAAIAAGYMIGSGITEAACKTVVKARTCGSGMRWNTESIQQILCLRALRRSTNRWEQFWRKLDRQGC